MYTSVRFLVIAPIATAALLAGCAAQTATPKDPPATSAAATDGVAAMSVKEILTAARDALDSSSSFHVKNTDRQNGVLTVSDIAISGSDFTGTVTTGDVPLEMIKVGDDMYLKGDTWWKNKLGTDLVKGKYGKFSAPNDFYTVTAGMFGRANYTTMLDQLATYADKTGKGAVTTINGQQAIALSGPAGTVYVAATGKPYPIRIQGGEVVFDFSDFEKPVEIKTPAPADVLVLVLK